MPTEPQFHIITLGCAKNLVDSESMAAILDQSGYRASSDPSDADFIIVNTCGFIGPARDESIRTLQEIAHAKNSRQSLIAAGCLTQRYGQQVLEKVPGIDGLIGTRRWMDILKVVKALEENRGDGPIYHLPGDETIGSEVAQLQRAAVQGASAYIKIADGCRRPCAFCAIPLIKGTAVSRPPEVIQQQAVELAAEGVQEIILIAQDTTDYGHDLGMKEGLADLLVGIIDAAPQIRWIRLMYAYPGYVTDRLIEVMASYEQVLPYLDIPLQHSQRETLLAMRRPANMDWVRTTLNKMRDVMPEIALRTTLITGYPSETEQAFEDLLAFVEEIEFDRVGVFTYSFEKGTASEALGDPIPTEVKELRRDRLMEVQQAISLRRNQSFIGQRLSVLIEGSESGISLGRSYRDAPEIDGMVIVEGELPVGSMIPVEVTGALPYDLTAIPVR